MKDIILFELKRIKDKRKETQISSREGKIFVVVFTCLGSGWYT